MRVCIYNKRSNQNIPKAQFELISDNYLVFY